MQIEAELQAIVAAEKARVKELEARLEAIRDRCEDARVHYQRYIRPDMEQTDFSGFLAGICWLAKGGS
jgi:hypothetical protein